MCLLGLQTDARGGRLSDSVARLRRSVLRNRSVLMVDGGQLAR
jgi:hypothetical protein